MSKNALPVTWHRRSGSSTVIRSKNRSTRQCPFVSISLRSQMLYPVELRAPERESVNLRRRKRASNEARTLQQDGLLIYCLWLWFGKEFLKTGIVTDWVPDGVDL
jgi:hypothetical protein